jgi:hypothetical protein
MKLVMYIRFESPLGNAELAEENKGAGLDGGCSDDRCAL